MRYDARNRRELDKLAPNTRKAAYKWYQHCIDCKLDILITETLRDKKTQEEYVKKGVSQTMKSWHLVGQALDFVPVTATGATDYNAYGRPEIIAAINYAKSLGFKWGGDWTSFIDKPHLEYPYRGYGTDKALDKEQEVEDDMQDIDVYVNGEKKAGAGKLSKDGRTFLQVAEFNGKTVHVDKWDNKTKTLYVKTT